MCMMGKRFFQKPVRRWWQGENRSERVLAFFQSRDERIGSSRNGRFNGMGEQVLTVCRGPPGATAQDFTRDGINVNFRSCPEKIS